MSKHHIEDVDGDVRLRVATVHRDGKNRHGKSEAEENYPAFAANIRQNQQFHDRYTQAAECASIAGLVMQASGSRWDLRWVV